jgi:murein DD-endopeptidase MepM/ murein hydrolase activator NlpD
VPTPRTLCGLTALALCLAGCGAPGDGPEASPQFIVPSETSATSAVPAPAVSAPAISAPAATASPAPGPSASRTPTATPPKPATAVKYVFPVNASNVAFHPTHSKYPATDIFADCGKPAVATTSGVVLEISLTDTYVEGQADGPNNGGLSVSLLGDDGVRYYGSHLSKVLPGIRAGVRVRAGQQLGDVGHTGNASGVCHLHFGISPPCAKVGDWKVRRGVVWPATYLTSWRAKGSKSPVATVAAWKKSHNCKA